MKRKYIVALLAPLFIAVSCNDSFFDINENPNSPTEEALTPQLVMPMVLNATAKKMAIDYDFAAFWTGYWARGSSFGPSIPLENYDITTSFQQNQWVNGNTSVVNPAISWYDILMDAKVMGRLGRQSGEPFYVGAEKVIRAIGFMYLVDMYNNVPYSQALDLENYLVPAYDNGQDIYNDLLLQLDSARMIFRASDLEVSEAAANADIMFGGDLIMWRKLANTWSLKLLVHQSEVLDGIPTTELAKITADGSGFLMAGETADVQPGYAGNQYQQNPVYGTYVRDHNNSLVDDFNRASNYMLNRYRDNGDIRYQYVFMKAVSPVDGEEYQGNDLGQEPEGELNSSGESIVAGPGIVSGPSDPQWLFTSVESLFLQAEAAQRGWLSGVDAEEAYRNAVRESFSWLGVPNAVDVADEYMDEQEIANWASADNKIELIINQKHLALPAINNFEAWVDYRRLGFPSDVPLTLDPSAGDLKVPVRLLYPQNEYSYNAKNVNAQGNIDAQTSRIFWDVD